MEGTGTVIDERAAMIATAVMVAVGLIIVAVRHREVLFGRKNAAAHAGVAVKLAVSGQTASGKVASGKLPDSMHPANQALGGKASGQ